MINLNPCKQSVAFGLGQNKKTGSCKCGCPTSSECLTSMAIDLGLPYTASWKDIKKAIDAQERASMAIELGLPYTASWKDIKKAIEARKAMGLWFA